MVMCKRHKSKKSKGSLSSIIQPLPVQPAVNNADDINIGEELTGTIRKGNKHSTVDFSNCRLGQ